MKIIDHSLNEERLFENLELEDVFRFDDRLFMKVSNDHNGQINAYDFTRVY